MTRSFRHVIGALRVAALCLLVVGVIFGPTPFSGSAAFAAVSEPCGVSCPCDEAAEGDQAGELHEQSEVDDCEDEGSTGSTQDDGDPCRDGCPDDCPNCRCSLGIGMAILPFPVTSGTVTCAAASVPRLVEIPASGARPGVFRPPRSLT